MCAQRTVCEDLTRRSVVRSRIAVLYLGLKIYISERKRIIYFMSARDCLLLCVCVRLTIVHNSSLLARVCETLSVGMYV